MGECTRREVIQKIAVSAAAATTGCIEPGQPEAALTTPSAVEAREMEAETMSDPLVELRPLPVRGPWHQAPTPNYSSTFLGPARILHCSLAFITFIIIVYTY